MGSTSARMAHGRGTACCFSLFVLPNRLQPPSTTVNRLQPPSTALNRLVHGLFQHPATRPRRAAGSALVRPTHGRPRLEAGGAFSMLWWPAMTDEERDIIDALERDAGRRLTAQEVFLSLEQARALGEIAAPPTPRR
jgi:hypothetical protein